METSEQVITTLLRRLGAGDRSAEPELLSQLYGLLHRLAQSSMAGERKGHTLQPTALVHEAWMRLVADPERQWSDRGHFLRFAARAMRNVLVDHARARQARHGERRVDPPAGDFDRMIGVYEGLSIDVLALHDALTRLTDMDPELARLVELRYFAGLSIDETAEAIGQSPTGVDRSWRVARAWLGTQLALSGDG